MNVLEQSISLSYSRGVDTECSSFRERFFHTKKMNSRNPSHKSTNINLKMSYFLVYAYERKIAQYTILWKLLMTENVHVCFHNNLLYLAIIDIVLISI